MARLLMASNVREREKTVLQTNGCDVNSSVKPALNRLFLLRGSADLYRIYRPASFWTEQNDCDKDFGFTFGFELMMLYDTRFSKR